MNFFCQTVNDWLRVTEIRIQDLDVTPDDSVSQLGLRNRKRSGCGSAYSRSSRASSISVARAKEAARIAELQAEVHALKQRQLIHETELWLKKEELDLQVKKDQLKLEMEFKKAVSRESAYAKADSERNTRVASFLLTSRIPPVDLHAVAISDGFSGDLKQKSSPVFHGANFSPEEHKTQHKVPSHSSSDSDEKSGLSDQAFHILEQQNRVMEEFVNQQQKNTLPRRQVPIFDGNPLSYCTFMRAFETVIESNESDSGGRLYYLEQHTSGRAREIVRSCMYLNPGEGYSKAKKLLEARFGQKHNIAMAYVDQLTNGPYIKAEDAESLEGFSILLSSCISTLKAIGYLNKIEGPDNVRKIIERLPPKLQSSWRDNADRILNADKREVCIEDIASFVEEKSRTLSNPIFGKLPLLAKDKKKSQMWGAKSNPEGFWAWS